jgi:hypothetical protein
VNTVRIMVLGTLLAAAWPAFADPPSHAPANGYRAKHQYTYYPSHRIYYEPANQLWFWMNGGSWSFGATLPVGLEQYTSGGISVELDTDRPYTEQAYVEQTYVKGKKSKSHGGPPGYSKGKGPKH